MAAALGGLALSVPDFILTIRDNIVAPPQAAGRQSVRRGARLVGGGAPACRSRGAHRQQSPFPRRPHAVAGEHILGVACRPLIVFCRPGNGHCVCAAAAASAAPKSTREFLRVFDGEGTPNDVHDLATKYGCDVVVLVPQDKAWDHDPFAAGPDYRLAETREGRWRIYVREK